MLTHKIFCQSTFARFLPRAAQPIRPGGLMILALILIRSAIAQAEDPARPDDLGLLQKSIGQAAQGDWQGSLLTASQVRDDRARGSALHGIRGRTLDDVAARGGGSMADFTQLINLIQDTIAPDTWIDTGDGDGSISEYNGGVYVDASGVLQRRQTKPSARGSERLTARSAAKSPSSDQVRKKSNMRMVSLNRLERAAQILWSEAKEPTEAMRYLAGVSRIDHLIVLPESGDLVIVGPAAAWLPDDLERMVSVESGRPVLHLDDFVVILRNALTGDGRFGCSIVPHEANLAKAKAFLEAGAGKPLPAGGRTAWSRQLRAALGKQKIELQGIDPRTRVAQVLVEADYHMKLIGMGLESGVPGVESYLDSLTAADGPNLEVLRWWFALSEGVQIGQTDNVYSWSQPIAELLSENELLTRQGKRIHTGTSEHLNQQFARSFTRNFAKLAEKYPVYADLENMFQWALVAALITHDDLPSQVGWHMTHFGTEQPYAAALSPAPQEVATVMNHRRISRTTFVTGVSGGVRVSTKKQAEQRIADQPLPSQLADWLARHSPPKSPDAWWWDVDRPE